jgi:hypothetical protein
MLRAQVVGVGIQLQEPHVIFWFSAHGDDAKFNNTIKNLWRIGVSLGIINCGKHEVMCSIQIRRQRIFTCVTKWSVRECRYCQANIVTMRYSQLFLWRKFRWHTCVVNPQPASWWIFTTMTVVAKKSNK